MDNYGSSAPFGPLCKLWLQKITKAKDFKQREYRNVAHEVHKFFDGAHDFMYGNREAEGGMGLQVTNATDGPSLNFRMTLNKVAEGVDRIIPRLYFDNPTRTVGRRQLDVPNDIYLGLGNPTFAQFAMQAKQASSYSSQVVSSLVGLKLNYTPNEMGLLDHSWRSLIECLVGGMGVLWTEIHQPKGATRKLVGSTWDSVYDNYLADPDAQMQSYGKYVIRRCQHPTWMVEDMYQWPRGSLKSNVESVERQAQLDEDEDAHSTRIRDSACDTIVYYKIYSRMGMGGRLQGAKEDDPIWEALETFGDYCYIVVAEGHEWPLNVPPQMVNSLQTPQGYEALKAAVKWPIPFYGDSFNPWPCSLVEFKPRPGCVYSASHFKSALGELKLMNWCLSYLAGHTKWSSRPIVAYAGEEEPEFLDKIVNGNSITLIKFKRSMTKKIEELLQFKEYPPPPQSVIELFNLASRLFDLRTGLTPLMYGESSAQYRSAEEASIKGEMTTQFIDQMSRRTVEWQCQVARKEAIAARTMLGPADVAGIFQERWNPNDPMNMINAPLSFLWGQHVFKPNPADLESVVAEFEYRIEAESLRRPNKAKDLANFDQTMQTMMPLYMQYYQASGDPTKLNWLEENWARARQMEPPPPWPAAPPPPPMPPQGAPQPAAA